MANYYTNFSFALKVNEAEKDWLERTWRLAEAVAIDDADQAELKKALGREDGEDFDVVSMAAMEATEHDDYWSVWIHDDCANMDTDFLGTILQEFLVRFRDDLSFITVEFAYTCDKARLDAFGGSLMLVMARGIEWMSTSDPAIVISMLENLMDGEDTTTAKDLNNE